MIKKEGKDSAVKVPAKKNRSPRQDKMTAREREELLIENFAGLQKAMTNLSIKFENLSGNIINLLNIFELSAKHYIQGGKDGDTDLLKKIDSLLEQNKTIAKGLVLMEEEVRKRAPSQVIGTRISREMRPKPLPRI